MSVNRGNTVNDVRGGRDMSAPATCDVWSLYGALLREDAPADAWSPGLAPGVYIIRPADAPARKAVVR